MAATVKAFTQQLKALAAALQSEAPRILETMALTGKSLVELRIQNEGIADYSTNLVPSWYMGYTSKAGYKNDRSKNARGKKYIQGIEKRPKNERLTNWHQFRKAQGLTSERVDLNYTGRMWGGIVLQQVTRSGTKFIARVGGSDEEVDLKLYYNTARYGEFLTPNEAEQLELNQIAEDIFSDLIRRHLK
jgi:hypothetical protein